MYDKTDPRASLTAQPSSVLVQTGLVAETQEARFYDAPPRTDNASGQSWFLRGKNFLTAYSQAVPGATFARVGQVDEYCVLLPKTGAEISWMDQSVAVPGHSVAFVPPGDSRVTLHEGGEIVRLFSTQSDDLVSACANARSYDAPRRHIPPFQPWPAPEGGWAVRQYSLDVPRQEGRFGRIFRCTTLMVNVLEPFEGPRNPSSMSPHHHDDLEQGSLVLSGTFTHHLRWPWTTDIADWRADRAVEMGAPSLLVIPPPVIHTTRATGAGRNLLVDIFSPPRLDFSEQPGWVLNARDYPVPSKLAATAT